MTGTSEKEVRVESTKGAASLDKTNFTKSKIFSDIIIQNNKRLLYVFLSIMIIANLAVTAIKAAGIGSHYLEFYQIGIEVVAGSGSHRDNHPYLKHVQGNERIRLHDDHGRNYLHRNLRVYFPRRSPAFRGHGTSPWP